jgi:putative flippase GtrA
MLERLLQIPAVAKVTSHIPPAQFGRYLIVGMFNTVFGYSSYVVLTALLTPYIPYAYVVAGVLSNLLNITVAYFNYKWFIFKTKGNYLREWLRCLLVYSGGMATGAVLLPIVVLALRLLTPFKSSAPYVAGALLLIVNVVLSFIGHKKFSFAAGPDAPPDPVG